LTLLLHLLTGGVLQQKKNTKQQGLTVEKLMMAKRMLNKGTCHSGEKKYFVCSQNQLTDLLHNTQETSCDYNNNVIALITGEIKSFMVFEFIISESLTGITPLKNQQDAIPVQVHIQYVNVLLLLRVVLDLLQLKVLKLLRLKKSSCNITAFLIITR